MVNPCNHLTDFAPSKRSLRRLGLMTLAALITLGAAQAWPGTTGPMPTIQEVLPPTPPGTQPGSQMFLQATVMGPGSTEVTFYLSESPAFDSHAVEMGSTTASSAGTVGIAGVVPQDVPPGIYYVLACIGSNCVAGEGTIAIMDQSLSAIDRSVKTAIRTKPPGPEFFPEEHRGTEIGSPFPCPISAHGQYPSSCVWVTTPKRSGGTLTGTALWYCPTGNPYPYQVAIGFDPLWQDLSYGFFLTTRPVSFTKYKTDFFGPFSYAGTDGGRGYALFKWTAKEKVPRSNLQMRYLCTDRRSNSAYP
jgi:hypothetical protein